MILKVGDQIFYEANVAFHLIRDNPYSPWVVIGTLLTCGDFADARYPEHPRLRKEFKDEAQEAGKLAGTYEFMNRWHLAHQEVNDVVSKPIRYCTKFKDFWQVLESLGRTFNFASSSDKFGRLAIMLKSRERYFPIVFQKHGKNRSETLAALRSEGYIK